MVWHATGSLWIRSLRIGPADTPTLGGLRGADLHDRARRNPIAILAIVVFVVVVVGGGILLTNPNLGMIPLAIMGPWRLWSSSYCAELHSFAR